MQTEQRIEEEWRIIHLSPPLKWEKQRLQCSGKLFMIPRSRSENSWHSYLLTRTTPLTHILSPTPLAHQVAPLEYPTLASSESLPRCPPSLPHLDGPFLQWPEAVVSPPVTIIIIIIIKKLVSSLRVTKMPIFFGKNQPACAGQVPSRVAQFHPRRAHHSHRLGYKITSQPSRHDRLNIKTCTKSFDSSLSLYKPSWNSH